VTERNVVQHGESPEPVSDGDLARAEQLLEDDMPMHALAEALRAPGSADELRHEQTTVAAFVAERRALPVEPLAVVGGGRRSARRAALVITGVGAAVLLVGGAAAAATGSLPAPLQSFAHTVVGAPEPTTDSTSASGEPSGRSTRDGGSSSAGPVVSPSTSTSPAAGPDASPSTSSSPSHLPSAATGAGAKGLCTAFLKDSKPTAAKEHSQAYAALVAAAAAHGQTVTAYCGAITRPAASSSPTASTTHGAKPTAPPGQVKKTATPTPAATSTGKGNGNGNGKGNGNGNGNGKGSGTG
jgi:hypothetical protein